MSFPSPTNPTLDEDFVARLINKVVLVASVCASQGYTAMTTQYLLSIVVWSKSISVLDDILSMVSETKYKPPVPSIDSFPAQYAPVARPNRSFGEPNANVLGLVTTPQPIEGTAKSFPQRASVQRPHNQTNDLYRKDPPFPVRPSNAQQALHQSIRTPGKASPTFTSTELLAMSSRTETRPAHSYGEEWGQTHSGHTPSDRFPQYTEPPAPFTISNSDEVPDDLQNLISAISTLSEESWMKMTSLAHSQLLCREEASTSSSPTRPKHHIKKAEKENRRLSEQIKKGTVYAPCGHNDKIRRVRFRAGNSYFICDRCQTRWSQQRFEGPMISVCPGPDVPITEVSIPENCKIRINTASVHVPQPPNPPSRPPEFSREFSRQASLFDDSRSNSFMGSNFQPHTKTQNHRLL